MALMPVTDAAFLLAESRQTPTHVGGLQIFELPDGAGAGWLREQHRRMLAVDEMHPLFVRRARRSPATLGQWAWETDDQLDLGHHVRHSALPAPGGVGDLFGLASRLHESLLDRTRPLWELHLVEGLAGNRFAIYTKVHHALLDGVSALRLLGHSLSSDPDSATRPVFAARPHPVSEHRGGGEGPVGVVATALRTVRAAAGATPTLLGSAHRALGDDLATLPFRAPPSLLNGPVSGARRFAGDSWSLRRLQAVGHAAGATVNDVVLAMCAGGLRRYLDTLGALPDEPLTAMVPVSTRLDDSAGGNALGAILCSLATTTADPAERLARIRRSVDIGKATIRDRPAVQVTLLSAAAVAPLALTTLLGRDEGHRPAFNVIVSNMVGPRHTLYFDGARLQGIYPMSVPYHGQALNITTASYAGDLEVGLTGCRRRVPHLQRLVGDLDAALVELETAHGVRGPRATGHPT